MHVHHHVALLMRWSIVVLFFLTSAFAEPDTDKNNDNATSVTVAVSVSALGAESTALALQDLAILVLGEAGVTAHAVPAPSVCELADDPACLKAVLSALSGGAISAALVTVPAENSPASWLLREAGIEELDEVVPATRRSCLTNDPAARSLLDLADVTVAERYHITDKELEAGLRISGFEESHICTSCSNNQFTPDWCKNNGSCAILLTSSVSEARVLTAVIRKHHLYAAAVPLGAQLGTIAKAFNRPIIACDWAPEFSQLIDINTQPLGIPPCLHSEQCPFETRRIVKYVNVRELARAPSAIRGLVRLKLDAAEVRVLSEKALLNGHEKAAQEFFEARPASVRVGEVRVAVLLPNATSREAYDARALAAAAALAEDDLGKERPPGFARFKVEVYDDGCNTARAYKYLNDALGTSEYGALSALAGPACGAAWADVTRHSFSYNLPMLAYTSQAPATGARSTAALDSAESRLQLLAAGDARETAEAVAALLIRMGWRRMAVLSEHATRPLADAARAHAEFAVHVELPIDGADVDKELISNWAARVSAANAHVIFLCVEDGRVARAALCAARAAGVSPRDGAVWLLCGDTTTLLHATPADNCTTQQLEEVAAGHLSVSPEWELMWREGGMNASASRRLWEARWRSHCRRVTSHGTDGCDIASASAHAALLYDVLRLWAAALDRLLAERPAAIDDLHNRWHVSELIEDATASNYSGLTGNFEWTTTSNAHARRVPLILSQWTTETGSHVVGRWANGTLELNESQLHWYTADGRAPDDGSEYCALQGLADALNTDCRTTFAVLGAFLVALLLVILAAVAYYCKRRTEREYRERLAALGMRPLLGKSIGLDRWEVPRERVVINRKLGTGAFGTVYGGHALLAEDRGWTAVAVKTLKAGATTEEKLDFLSEAEAMKRFDHKNVVRLLGVVTKTEPVCTVMEFMLYGDLKNYLLARRHLAMGGGLDDEAGEGREADEASPRRLTGMASDVARALSYLAQLRYVHRDVAARNCLVSARRVVKLADFGMTRLVFENDYYRFSRKGMLPVRWMAPESLALGVFSPASDVWSFGVLLYEIVTFGSLPFQGLSNAEVLARVKSGDTLDLPPGLKPQLEGLIKSCWQQDSKSRPTASEIAVFLADAPRLLAPCLDVPLDALPLDADPPWRLPRDQAEARWVSWAAPASAATDTTYLSTDGAIPLDTDSFLS